MDDRNIAHFVALLTMYRIYIANGHLSRLQHLYPRQPEDEQHKIRFKAATFFPCPNTPMRLRFLTPRDLSYEALFG